MAQETDPPDLGLALLVTVLLLGDLRQHLRHPRRHRHEVADLEGRIDAVATVLHRLRAMFPADTEGPT